MSSSRRPPDDTPVQYYFNLAGLNQSYAAHEPSSDRQSLFTLENFEDDVDKSVGSSTGWDQHMSLVSPPTSTYSQSNAGDFGNPTTCDPYYQADAVDKWPCQPAMSDFGILGERPLSGAVDVGLENTFADNYMYPEPAPSVDNTNYLSNPQFLGDAMDVGNNVLFCDMANLDPPKITVEDTGGGGMGNWLSGMYTPGLGIANNNIAPQAGPSSMSATTLGVKCPNEPADDQATESSVNTSHTSHSCLTCSKNFGNKDDLRRHQRYHDTKKHTCRICGKGFVHPKDLRRHKTTHSTDRHGRPCPVDGCTTSTGRKDNLKRHVQNKHPEFDFEAWTATC